MILTDTRKVWHSTLVENKNTKTELEGISHNLIKSINKKPTACTILNSNRLTGNEAKISTLPAVIQHSNWSVASPIRKRGEGCDLGHIAGGGTSRVQTQAVMIQNLMLLKWRYYVVFLSYTCKQNKPLGSINQNTDSGCLLVIGFRIWVPPFLCISLHPIHSLKWANSFKTNKIM